MASYLREYRVRANLNQREVAERLGMKPPSIYKWEKGITSPTLRELMKLAEIYGIEPVAFFVDPDAPTPEAMVRTQAAVWAEVAGVHPTAFFHFRDRIDEFDAAKRLSRVVKGFDRLPAALQDHLVAVVEAYPWADADEPADGN